MSDDLSEYLRAKEPGKAELAGGADPTRGNRAFREKVCNFPRFRV